MMGMKESISFVAALTLCLSAAAFAQKTMQMHSDAADADMMTGMAKMQHEMASATNRGGGPPATHPTSAV